MSFSFAGTLSPECVTFTDINGKNVVIALSHLNNLAIRDGIKKMQALMKAGDEAGIRAQWQILTDLADIPAYVTKKSQGKVSVRDGTVFYQDEEIHSSITRRILWGLSEGYDMDSYLRFLENLMENPSKRAVDELFDFLEACNMGITPDGHFLAYKSIRSNYTDSRTGKFDNSPGQILEMPRNKVDEDKNRTCSSGFHFCSQSYLPHFGSGSDKIVILKINPRDVVAIPADYANAKGRACRYEVVGEYFGERSSDPLSKKPVWSERDVSEEFDSEYDDDSFCEECDSRLDEYGFCEYCSDNTCSQCGGLSNQGLVCWDCTDHRECEECGAVLDDDDEQFCEECAEGPTTTPIYANVPETPKMTFTGRMIFTPTVVQQPPVEKKSSFIDSFIYKNGTLYVDFSNGDSARYFEVPMSIYLEFEKASSKGRAFNELIRNNYRFIYD